MPVLLLIIAICLVVLTLPFWIAVGIGGIIAFIIFFKWIITWFLLCLTAAIGIVWWNAKHPDKQIK